MHAVISQIIIKSIKRICKFKLLNEKMKQTKKTNESKKKQEKIKKKIGQGGTMERQRKMMNLKPSKSVIILSALYLKSVSYIKYTSIKNTY